jgi:hypothetical protein
MESLEERAKEFDDLHPFQKIMAVSTLKKLDKQNKKLDQIRNNFPWGRIIDIICIGNEYQFVESEENVKQWSMEGKFAKEKIIVETKKYYHIYIDYKDIHRSEKTLDRAIITALCYKYDSVNTMANEYIFKMLSMNKEEI